MLSRNRLMVAVLGMAALALVIAGCAAAGASPRTPTPTPSPTPDYGGVPSIPTGVPVIVRGGQTVELAGQYIVLTFVKVLQDSRCPMDAVCIQPGDATILIGWGSTTGERGEVEVTIGPEGKGSAQFGKFTITVTDLLPYPAASQPTPDLQDYQVTLRVDFTAGS